MLVGENLNFDVAGALNSLLNIHSRVSERCSCFARGLPKCCFELLWHVHDAQPLAAATRYRLERDRETYLVSDLARLIRGRDRFQGAGYQWHPRLRHQLASFGLQPEVTHGPR